MLTEPVPHAQRHDLVVNLGIVALHLGVEIRVGLVAITLAENAIERGERLGRRGVSRAPLGRATTTTTTRFFPGSGEPGFAVLCIPVRGFVLRNREPRFAVIELDAVTLRDAAAAACGSDRYDAPLILQAA